MKKMLILITLFSLSILGCDGKSSKPAQQFSRDENAGLLYRSEADFTEETAYETSNLYGSKASNSPASDLPDSSNSANLTNPERKLVKSANIRIKVENLEAADASIINLMEKYNGYSASTNFWENSYNYALRIPANLYDTFLAEINGMGRVIHRSENVEDVTLQYYDLEGRLESKRELLKTFQSYLGKAKNIDEILSVETRIADLQQEIDYTGTQLRNLVNQIDYASIHLELVGPAAFYPNKSETLGEKIKQLFGNFGTFFSALAVILIGIVIYGFPIILLLALLYLVLFGKIGLLKKLWKMVAKKV